MNWLKRLFSKKRNWIVRYWYYDRLGVSYELTTLNVKLHDTKDYVQGQDLPHDKYRTVERYFKDGYVVKFGFWENN